MGVYYINNEQKKILLFGYPAAVTEVASLLEKHEIAFNILLPIDEEHEQAITEQSQDPSIPSILEHYRNTIIRSFESITTPFDIIIDVSIEDTDDRIAVLDLLLSSPGDPLLLVSTLTTTATELAGYLHNSNQKIIGFNGTPFLLTNQKVMEIAPSMQSEPEALTMAKEFFESLSYSVEVVQDRVGLVTPRVLATLINEAAFAVMENVASAEDIDNAMKLGVNYPYGLLEWADMIGIDVVIAILQSLSVEYEQERYRTCVYLKQLVRAGRVGKSVGQGFFTYPTEQNENIL